MTPWTRLADELRNDATLADLSSLQLEAIIDVLALTICADGTIGVLEKMELDRLLQMLPWFEYKDATIRSHTQWALDEAAAIRDEAGFVALASKAAQTMPDTDVRRKVFEMAAALACSDLHLHRKEKQALAWLAATFGIDEGDANSMIAQAAEEHL